MATQSSTEVDIEIVSRPALLVRWIVSAHLVVLVVQMAMAVAFAGG